MYVYKKAFSLAKLKIASHLQIEDRILTRYVEDRILTR